MTPKTPVSEAVREVPSVSFARHINEYIGALKRLDEMTIERMAQVLLDAWRMNRTVFCCGNGGSASNASHFIMDLTRLTAPARGPRLRAMALNENVAAISAISNDVAYEEIFVEQMKAFVEPGDVVIGFSTSGASPNVLRAIEYANSIGATTLGVTGRHGRDLQALAQVSLAVSSSSVQQIEDATMVVAHLLCLRVKELIAQETDETTREVPVLLPHLRAADSIAM